MENDSIKNISTSKNKIFACCSYSPSQFYFAFEAICKNGIVLTEHELRVLYNNKLMYDQHCTYLVYLFYLMEKYNYYEKNLYELIKKSEKTISYIGPKKYIHQWLLKPKIYSVIQLYKNKKYNTRPN